MGSIEFCKLNLAFEEDLRGGKSSSKSVKVIENGDFRGFDSSQAGSDQRFSEVAVGECVSGTGFEVCFKCHCLFFGFKGKICFNFPWFEL